MDITTIIKDYGFPIFASVAMGGFVYYIWRWVTETVDPLIGSTKGTLINLIDRVRMLDNDMIRMNMKLSIILENKGTLDKTLTDDQKEILDYLITRYQGKSEILKNKEKEK
jgi:heme exporter protein D